jgi:aminocarboxymuconate-semialdehyde decarboxylase
MGLRGVEIGSNIGGVSLGSERLLGFMQESERLGVPIFVHALNPTFNDRLPGPAVAGFGFATEIGLAAASIVSSGTAEKCPDLRLALSHGAGGFPLTLTRAEFFWRGTWNEEPRPAGQAPRPGQSQYAPSELARRFYYDALVFDRRALRYLIDMIGPRQLLLGTDFPAMQREVPAFRTLASLDLPADEFADITWNNCFRWLGTSPSGGD